MTAHLAVRNERRNRRRAMALTVLITASVLAGVIYAGSPEVQSLLDQWIMGLLGGAPQAEVQP